MRGNEISQKSFQREIAMTYLKSCQNNPKGRGRKPSNLPGAENARFDRRGHLVIPIPNNKRRRCMSKVFFNRENAVLEV